DHHCRAVVGVRPHRGARGAARERPSLRRGGRGAACGGGRPHGRLPVGRARGAAQERPARPARPGGARRRRSRRHLDRPGHRGALAGRREHRPDRGGQQARHDRPAAVGQRGAQGALPAGRGDGRVDLLLRPVGARGRLGRGGHAHTRGPRRRRVRPGRHQGLDQPGRRVHALHRHGGDRAGRRRTRHLGVRGARRRPRLHGRAARAQDGHQGLAHLRGPLRELPHPRRPHDRRARHRLQDRAGHPRPHPADHRRPGRGHRAGQPRRRPRLHQGAPAVRQARRRLPGRAVHAGRHGDEDRGGPPAGLRRRGQGRPDSARPHLRLRGGQVLRLRHRHAGGDRRRAAVRRLRLHAGLPGRALHARCEDHADLRGHEPDPAGGDGPGAAAL
ncbi:MAG: Acyl-CoA dehydrogenase, short-chain specific, partial [uncultured Frankineae bacterium]